ncbi:uncharacterized protein LOC115243992 [Formica exsecta]|uniref:uncharacterized protein LOC115243992 n=1 Tax=Formica exsecta TaxID=72781 RepID=UPI001142CF1E|nr:uncharacterized protein LOC115243992 [Formica exsecta]
MLQDSEFNAAYRIQVTGNFYSNQLSMGPLFYSEVILTMRTKSGKLEAPENVTVEALTPTIAIVYWMLPKKLICVPVIYEKYRVFVRIYSANFSNHYNNNLSKTLYMYSESNNITLNEVSINGMNISWIPSVNLTIHYVLEYKNVEMQKWQTVDDFEQNKREKVTYYIENLLPGTLYEFHLILKYPKYEKDFIWPSNRRL